MKNSTLNPFVCFLFLLTIIPSDVFGQCQDGETFFSNCYGNSESNLVIFEVCPASGMAAEATIVGGTYDDFGAPNDNLHCVGPKGIVPINWSLLYG